MSAGEHEMRDYHAPQDAPRPTINQTPGFKPYLGLRAKLSQIWLNRWTILLLLVLVRLMFAMSSTNDSIKSARREALSACTSVEKLGSSMASMPHYMSKGVNEMTAASVEKAVEGLMKMLYVSVQGVEEIVLFVIHMFTSTYLCLITLVVSGSMKAALDLAKELEEFLQKTIGPAANEIGDAIDDVTDGINSIMNKIPIPGTKKPQIDVDGQLDKLKNFKFPTDMLKGINDLEGKIPNFEEVQNKTDSLIRIPFDEVQKLIKEGMNYTFDRSILPVPQKEQLNFCSEGNTINNFFDDLLKMVANSKNIAIGVLVAAAILVCFPMAWQERRRHRLMHERAQLAKEGHDPMDVVYLSARPTSAGFGLWFARRFGSVHRNNVVRWAWAYATSEPMLFVLSLGAAGLFSCFCQWIVLNAIEDKAPELTNQVADFAGQVVKAVDNSSLTWAAGVNLAIQGQTDRINDDVFGWVNTTTEAINGTINVLVDGMNEGVEKAFGGTVLEGPVREVIKCTIGLKLTSIQNALTWAHDNAQVSFPGVKPDVFTMASLAEDSGSESGSALLVDPGGKTRDEITEAVQYVIDKIGNGIRTEALISTVLICIFLAVAIAGYIYAAFQFFRKDPHAARAYNIDQEEHADASPPSYVANDYNVNKAAPYTLSHRPFPTFESEPETEKVGQVTAHTTSARPGHLRASSHGDLADPSPLDDRANPFSDRSYPREK